MEEKSWLNLLNDVEHILDTTVNDGAVTPGLHVEQDYCAVAKQVPSGQSSIFIESICMLRHLYGTVNMFVCHGCCRTCQSLGRHCPRLLRLDLESCNAITDTSLIAIGSAVLSSSIYILSIEISFHCLCFFSIYTCRCIDYNFVCR